MQRSLKTFKDEFQNHLLNFLWRQWSALGVAGQSSGEDEWIIDPEALLLFTCTVGRRDPRLFDEMLDWLQENGRFINIMRLKRMMKIERFAGGRAVAAVAACMMRGREAAKWKRLAESEGRSGAIEDFFQMPDGKPVPVVGDPEANFAKYGFRRGPLRLRGHSQKFRAAQTGNLMLQLRALFGINVRCEIVLYLLTHESAHPSAIARDAYYAERAVQGTLVDMLQSGVVQLRTSGREKHYWLQAEPWATLLKRPDQFPRWVTWAPLFRALEQIWLKLDDPQLATLDPLLQSSELRRLMLEIRPALERARQDVNLTDDRDYLGESYLPVFFGDVLKLL